MHQPHETTEYTNEDPITFHIVQVIVKERRRSHYQIDKKLQEDAARPIIANNVRYNCFQPHVKNIKTMTNSLYNGWRFEDIYLDK